MPNSRRPLQVAAAVTSEDVSRAFYNSPIGADWDHWIVRMEVDPLAIVYVDDATGGYFYLPVTIGAGSGSDAVTFGEPEARDLEFVPKKQAAAGARRALVFAAREDTRPGNPPQPPSPSASGSTPERSGSMTDLATTLRQELGIADDADEDTVLAAVREALAERADPPPTPPGTPPAPAAPGEPVTPVVPVAASVRQQLPEGAVVIDAETLRRIEENGRLGVAAATRLAEDDRDRTIEAAVQAGKFPRARVEHWRKSWKFDAEGAKAAIASMPPNMVPIDHVGDPGDPNGGTPSEFDHLFSRPAKGA